MAVKYCSDTIPNYCESQKGDIDSTCHDLGKSAGKEIMYHPQKGLTCYCICSCIGEGSLVTLADGSKTPIEKVETGKTQILAAGRALKFQPMVAGQRSMAPRAHTDNTIYLTFTVDGQKQTLVCTQSHPFLLAEKGLCAAANITPDDKLLDRNGAPVRIDDLRWGAYDGGFWEIATSMTPPDPDLNGHLILTNGVVSGDFAVETYVNYPIGSATPIVDLRRGAEIVGSPEWLKKHGSKVSDSDEVIMVNGGRFHPRASMLVSVPSHAADFLPWWQADFLRLVAPKRPYNDPYALEMCEWLLDRIFRPIYKDINFLFDWYSEDINSSSWVTDGKKYVYLSGGLSRVEGFDYEGVALALAHEVGHLNGKPDGSKSGVTCEGEADFYGAGVALRNVWFGEQYFESTEKAIDQVKTLYKYMGMKAPDGSTLNNTAVRKDKAGRGYPSNDCRISTWEAAMAGPKKPDCAQCAPAP
ncbi:MAG: hypothetical protein JNM76_18160 [Betaproteobacteria bacterium]|nr:hypothetical protein [Betaproteobacteria bacterium]